MKQRSNFIYEGFSDSYKNYISYSNEIEVISDFLKKNIPQKEGLSLLDVGAGYGNITVEIAPLFEKIEVVEPNNKMYYILKDIMQMYNVRLHPFSFEEINLKKSFYDVVLCSHVLEYMKNWESGEPLMKILDVTKPSGLIFIVQYAQEGEYFEFIKQFMGDDFMSEEKNIIQQKLKPFVFSLNEEIVKTNLSVPSVDEVMKMLEYFFDLEIHKISDEKKKDVRDYFKNKLVNGKINLEILHSVTVAKKI